eukprot:scaffold45615_cov63-Phaeocystis_antarctica.AAC.3
MQKWSWHESADTGLSVNAGMIMGMCCMKSARPRSRSSLVSGTPSCPNRLLPQAITSDPDWLGRSPLISVVNGMVNGMRRGCATGTPEGAERSEESPGRRANNQRTPRLGLVHMGHPALTQHASFSLLTPSAAP